MRRIRITIVNLEYDDVMSSITVLGWVLLARVVSGGWWYTVPIVGGWTMIRVVIDAIRRRNRRRLAAWAERRQERATIASVIFGSPRRQIRAYRGPYESPLHRDYDGRIT